VATAQAVYLCESSQRKDLPPAALGGLHDLPVASRQFACAEAPGKLYSAHASAYSIHAGLDITQLLLQRILKAAGISREEWEAL
jgi:hypothetical protein